jgi:hypothetical protein
MCRPKDEPLRHYWWALLERPPNVCIRKRLQELELEMIVTPASDSALLCDLPKRVLSFNFEGEKCRRSSVLQPNKADSTSAASPSSLILQHRSFKTNSDDDGCQHSSLLWQQTRHEDADATSTPSYSLWQRNARPTTDTKSEWFHKPHADSDWQPQQEATAARCQRSSKCLRKCHEAGSYVTIQGSTQVSKQAGPVTCRREHYKRSFFGGRQSQYHAWQPDEKVEQGERCPERISSSKESCHSAKPSCDFASRSLPTDRKQERSCPDSRLDCGGASEVATSEG